MADRISQYSMGTNFGAPGMLPQQHHQMSQPIQQQQPGLQQESHHPMISFPEQNPQFWQQMQQMQQMRPQAFHLLVSAAATDGRASQSPKFGPSATAAVIWSRYRSDERRWAAAAGPSFQQSMHKRNNMLQTLQNNHSHSRQLELISLAQNQQNQNGPINLANRVSQPQGGPNLPPPNDMFSSPGMNPSEAMRRPSPSHPMPPSQSQPQPSNQSGMPMRSRTEIQERVQQLRVSITQVDAAMHQLQSQRNQHPAGEAVYSAKMRQLQMEKANRTETLSRLLAAVNSMNNNVNMPSNLNNGSQTNPWQNSTMQASFGQGASQPPNHLSSQNNPTHPHQPPHVPNSLAPNNVPPRSGPTPNAPFHTPMGNPTFPFNPNSQQNPGSGPSSNLPNPNGGPPVPMMTFNIPPLDKGRFDGAFRAWCHQKSISIDQRLLDIGGRPIDLYSLHSYVIQEGGLANVQSKDLWAVIGARMGFVQFPGGPPNDLPKSGPAAAQQLAHVYKEYLAAFDTVYITSLENRRKQLRVNAPPSVSGLPLKNWNPNQLRTILNCADKSSEQLRAQGLPEQVISFIEANRTQLQQMITDQSSFRDIIRPNLGQFDPTGNRPMPTQFPGVSQPAPSQPNNPNQGGFPNGPSTNQPPQNGPGPPRFSRELLGNAHRFITNLKSEMVQRVPSMSSNVEVSTEQRVEYNDLLEKTNRLAGEFENKLPIYYAMTKNEDYIKRLVYSIVIVQQQRVMLSWSSPRFIMSLDNLRQNHGQITQASDQLNIGLSNVMKAQGPQPMLPGPSNSHAPSNPIPRSGPIPQPSTSVAIPQQHSSPPQQATSTPTLVPPIQRRPPTLQPPPQSRKKPPPPPTSSQIGPSPTVPPAPTPPPAVSATTPVATPTNSNAAASPQTPKSPKNKVKPKPQTKQRRPSVKGTPTNATSITTTTTTTTEPAQPPPPPTAGVKRPHEGDGSTPSTSATIPAGPPNTVLSEPSPPKRLKTEWDGEVSQSLLVKKEAVESIRTDEDANRFFEQTMSELMKMSDEDGQVTTDISETLDQILKNYGGLPAPSTSGDLSANVDGSVSAPSLLDDFGQYFDFKSYGEDDESESKVNTPDLIPSSTNPSPESEADPSHHVSLSDVKLEDLPNPLHLGTLKEIDGGESAYYQSNDWKWDGPMPTTDQPWATFTS
ncbi:hypothetical protein K435DRAFT_852065 [Dendrothele bispora CBS 962.96]|uniref:ARID domain-containing protein n=1 Tax=Dendrothele bispora (strain CBS 962.96) TaxID=1314807 RepID=A0A4V4HHL7_DENBC|nr:hypothetical protein K435DRAFT_852065 [Dendrothele bispora CBS 962.96]